jgi:hypothetical protein
MLSIFAFILILIGVKVQIGCYSSETKFAVMWSTAISALVLIVFASKAYFP